MICTRNHIFKDSKYYIQVNNQNVGLARLGKLPKYIIDFNISTIVEWKWVGNQSQLVGFSLLVKSQLKSFRMAPIDCARLKQILDGKVTYNGLPEDLTVLAEIGSGSSSKVYRVQSSQSGDIMSCKMMRIQATLNMMEDIKEEVKILSIMEHPNIIKLKSFHHTETTCYILTELASGGTLKQFMDFNQSSLSQTRIRSIMEQILSAVAHIHKLGYVHRDIKPENILLREANSINGLKLIDFGFASQISETGTRYPQCGTPGYIAPEVISFVDNQPYNELCDVFSCGVLFYQLLTGRRLFRGREYKEIYRLNSLCDINCDDFNEVPLKFRDLLKSMLQRDANDRITAQQAYQQIQSMQQKRRVTITIPTDEDNEGFEENFAQTPLQFVCSKKCI